MFSLCKKHSDEIKEENKDYSEDYQLYDQIDYKIDDDYCIICKKIEHLRHNKITPLIRDLRNCKTQEEVDSIFKTYNILDTKEKIASLKEAVFNPKMFRQDFDEETELAIWIPLHPCRLG